MTASLTTEILAGIVCYSELRKSALTVTASSSTGTAVDSALMAGALNSIAVLTADVMARGKARVFIFRSASINREDPVERSKREVLINQQRSIQLPIPTPVLTGSGSRSLQCISGSLKRLLIELNRHPLG